MRRSPARMVFVTSRVARYYWLVWIAVLLLFAGTSGCVMTLLKLQEIWLP